MTTSTWCPDEMDRAILQLLAGGAVMASVGRQLGISERTVRRRTQAMSRRVGVDTTIEVIVHAVRMGWI